ncbi:MAG: alpha/beta fold hydrolase [Methanobrevibacter sp.]|jgi:homoserine O-acetyltransferase|nr:alpha/beta fold hydrolase [Candidatus Methanoflexus mossambicus]
MDKNQELLDFEESLIENNYTLSNLEFESGKVLKDLNVQYTTIGKAIKNDNGEIVNAIVYFHGSSGNYASIRRLYQIIGEKKVLDTNKYFIISVSTLGAPGSTSPSNSALKNKFPKYTILDMVNFQKKFLKEKFNIKKLKGIIGNSMGGFETLTWACEYPDDMDFIISIVSSHKVAGHNYSIFKIENKIIENDPEYNNGDYSKPIKSTGIANASTHPFGFSFKFYRYHQSNNDIDLAIEEMITEGNEIDANDTIFKNNACLNYDLTDKLVNIKAKTLLISITEDLYFPPELDAVETNELIKDSKLIVYDSLLGHVGSNEILKIENDLKEFLSD